MSEHVDSHTDRPWLGLSPASAIEPRNAPIASLGRSQHWSTCRGQRHRNNGAANRHSPRFLDLVRGWLSTILGPAMALPSRVIKAVARGVAWRRRRFAAHSTASTQHAAAVPRASIAVAPDGSAERETSPSDTEAVRAPSAPTRKPRFATVRVARDFGPGAYALTFAKLQRQVCGTLLDLVPARLLCADVFASLAHAWTAPPDVIPRVAIVMSFERWVLLRDAALAALQPLNERGIGVEVFYAEQAGYLDSWFTYGQVVHNVPPVIATLAACWQPAPSWPTVIDALARLVRAYTAAAELPVLLTDVAALALSCGGADQAAMLAREALYYSSEVPSSTRSKALRELGAAMLAQGHTVAGLNLLDQAIEMAVTAQSPAIGATALCQSGLFALNHGDYPDAERRFRSAIVLLSPPPRRVHVLALAHHHLGIALLFQNKRNEAAYHARAALALRSDPDSYLAEQDRTLLRLCGIRAESS